MDKKVRTITHAAILAALYTGLTHLQNVLLPGSASMAIQFRASEALCVLAFFSPAAIPGLTLGCVLFALTSGSGLPLDLLIGSAATAIATAAMWGMRRLTVRGIPLPGLSMPVVSNAILVGAELTLFIGGGFPLNALYVGIGEAAVMLVLGIPLYRAIRKRGLGSMAVRQPSSS